MKIFYISLVTICVVGQTAIFFKKKYENRKDRVAVGIVQVNILLGIPNQQPQHQDPNNVTMCINNQRWNQYLCSNTGTLLFVSLGNYLKLLNRHVLTNYLLISQISMSNK